MHLTHIHHSLFSLQELHYNISLRDTLIQAFQDDCVTPIPSNVTTLTSSITNTSLTHGDFAVFVDIKQDLVKESAIWEDLGVGEGLISMCVRVDLILPSPSDISVTFHEQKLYIDVTLTQGFNVTGIELDRTAATNETGAADFDYEVTACHCNALGECVNTVLTQGSDVLLCVETTAPNVEIVDIRDLTMTQGAFATTPIVDGVEDPLTESTINGKEAVIQYQIISAFFANPDPADIVATGTVLLGFTNDNGRRMLRRSDIEIVQQSPTRELLESGESVEEGWVVTMEAEGTPEHASSASRGGLIGGLVVMVVGVVVAVL